MGRQGGAIRGEGMAAALLWETLIRDYPKSSFRGSALQQTAEAYAEAQQYTNALELYTSSLADYPEEARAARADIRAEQIRLLVQRGGGQGSGALGGDRERNG